MKQESKKITKLKALSHSEVQNVGSSTNIGFAVNTTTQVIRSSQHINETNITTTFIIIMTTSDSDYFS
jgi:hypothetical protein